MAGVRLICAERQLRRICNRQHLFASPKAAAGWLAEHPDGTVVPVAEAFLAMTRA